MARALKRIPLEAFLADAPHILAKLEAEGDGMLLEHEGATFTVRPKARRAPRASHRFTEHDALFDIIGIANSDGPTDVSSNKHAYLADAAADLHEPE